MVLGGFRSFHNSNYGFITDPLVFLKLNFHCPFFKKNTEGGRTFSMRMIRNWNELYY